MVGLVLLFVGSVLLVNGMGGLGRVETRSMAVLNFMVGGLALIATLLLFVRAGSNADYLTVAQFFLFTFTYLFAATCLWLNLDMRAFGWFCFFVAVTTVPCALVTFMAGDVRFGSFWLIWGVLWFMSYLANAHGTNFGRALPFTTIGVGVLTCWIPGLLILTDRW